jgi:hypothetical protein
MGDIALSDVNSQNTSYLALHTGPVYAICQGRNFEERRYTAPTKYVCICTHKNRTQLPGWEQRPLQLGACHALARVDDVSVNPAPSRYRCRWHLTVLPIPPYALRTGIGLIPKLATKFGRDFDGLLAHIRY